MNRGRIWSLAAGLALTASLIASQAWAQNAAPAPGAQPAANAPAVAAPPPANAPALAPTAAAPSPAPVAAPATQPAPPPVAAPPPVPADEKSIREQTIYIPYRKLRDVFEQQGRGVFLPYEKFQELWKAAYEKLPRDVEPAPPVDALITEFAGTATVAGDVVTVTAKVRVEVLKEGWVEVPLRLNDAAITKASIDNEPARILARPGEGHMLLLEKQGKEPRLVTLDLEFAKACVKAPGRNSVAFDSPSAPVNRWEVRVPESGVKVEILPLLAATEVPAAPGVRETRVQAFVGAAPSVEIAWTPKAEGAKGLEALVSVQTAQQVSLAEGAIRTQVRLAYEISRAELATLLLEVPANQKVVNVFDANVREWAVEAGAATQTIKVQLFQPAKGAQGLVVELEKFGADADVAVPVVKALNVGRQQGVVVVKVGTGLRAEPVKRDGLLQLDANELPPALAQEKWDFSYRYAALPFDLTYRVEKIAPRILVDALLEARLSQEDLTLDWLGVFDVQRAGVFQFALQVPAGFEVRQVRGTALDGVTAAEVDTHHVEAGDSPRLTVSLSRKAEGKVGLAVQLYRILREPDLLTPTGKTATIPVPVPRVPSGSVERDAGRVVVYAPESLRVNPSEAKGLRPVTYDEAISNLRSLPEQGSARPVLCFAYSEDAVALTLTAERRSPQVTVRQLLVARIDSGVVKYEATLFTDVLYSGVKSLRLDVPTALADQLRVVTPGIRYEAIKDAAETKDLAAGYVAWRLSPGTEFLGSTQVRLVWERKLEKLDIGKSVDLEIPRLIPHGVHRAWGQIVLTKTESIDVTPTEKRDGLRPIDPQYDLMPGAQVPGAAQAFEFQDDWSLTVRATRYEAKDVKATSVERGLVRMVVTRSELLSVQAVYRIRSVRQRLAIKLPEKVEFDTQPLRINGAAVALEQGGPGEYFVPLVGQNQDTPFVLELRYLLRTSKLRFECPEFPDEPAIQQVYLSVFIPQEKAYLGMRGPWHDELVWRLRGFSAAPEGRISAGSLLAWIAEGVNMDQETLQNFTTDGRHLLFSAVRPLGGADSALRITIASERGLKAVLLILVLALGLALLPARYPARAIAVGNIIVLVVLMSVFLPTLARAVVNNGTVAAVAVVLVIWWIQHALHRRAAAAEAIDTDNEPAPPPMPPPPPTPPATEGGDRHA